MTKHYIFLTVKIVGYNTVYGKRPLGQPRRYKFARKCHEVTSKFRCLSRKYYNSL
jgi:hypothetical protein